MNYEFPFRRYLSSLLIFQLLLFSPHMKGQEAYPDNYFSPPVDFRMLLSGTFGELRAGHFHSGMDIKTGGVQGRNIFAVADGYVSRIKVSATGFGKTLYITHPNGFVSVYAHLSSFNERIGAYVKDKHYHYESFELNIFPGRGELQVRKGELVAYSGNSGGSSGPHLHFEMRLESTQTPVNPLLFGFEVKDYIRPEINWLKVYPASGGSMVDGEPSAKVFKIDGWGEKHRVKGHDTIHVSGPFSLGINTTDKLNDAPNRNGVYQLELFADGEKVYGHKTEKFDFVETRYINSLIDYGEYIENRRRYQRTEIDPNNRLSIYGDVKNRGILHFTDTAVHKLEFVVRDFAGNTSRLPIVIKSEVARPVSEVKLDSEGKYFSIRENNEFTAENIMVRMPGNALYRDVFFEYCTEKMPEGAFSRIHCLHRRHTPVHTYFDVHIIPDSIPPDTGKLLLVRITDEGKHIPYGGEWVEGELRASIRSFGRYTLLADTIAPEVDPVNIASGVIGPDRKTVKCRIRDDLSGIKSFRVSLNGKWLLMEYDAKNDLLVYNIDDRLKKGKNDFRLEVTDQRNNSTIFEKILIRK
jgi:hypothetical protein